MKQVDYSALATSIKQWGASLGFQQVGISDINLEQAESDFKEWLNRGFHGEMAYMSHHGDKRYRPELLVENTCRVISVRMDYNPPDCTDSEQVLDNPDKAFISRYALGRDYHKVIRKRLQKLADLIQAEVGDFGYRAFVDSAPVLEKPLAVKSGLGWQGKHTNIINKDSGSWFFLGEIYCDIPLPVDSIKTDHCGTCRACIDCCPTDAIIAPYQLDARLCISYLTIELKGSIPVELRNKMGNRIYGCDDCQLVCPWNRFSVNTRETDFYKRYELDNPDLLELIDWDEKTFLKKTEGSAIRRIGYRRWQRNIVVALGNSNRSGKTIKVLNNLQPEDDIVKEHVLWALEQLN